jgi:hypothetical protein
MMLSFLNFADELKLHNSYGPKSSPSDFGSWMCSAKGRAWRLKRNRRRGFRINAAKK